MSKKLTKKQRGFVKDYVETGNATLAAKKNYNIEPYNDNSAAATGSQVLRNPKVVAELERLGFSEEGANAVTLEIMYDKFQDASARLKAVDIVKKTLGSYAAEKTFNLTANASVDDLKTLIQQGLKDFRKE